MVYELNNTEMLILTSLRYALIRDLTKTNFIINEIIYNWEELPLSYKQLIKEELTVYMQGREKSNDVDVKRLKKILELPFQTKKAKK